MTEPIVSTGKSDFPSTSMSLIGLAMAQDAQAWAQIVYLYSPLVERWCRQRNLRNEEIDDVGQEVFISIFRSLHLFDVNRPGRSFRKWIWTITKNKITDFLKNKLQQPTLYAADGNDVAWRPPLPNPNNESDKSEDPSDILLVLRGCLEILKTEFEAKTLNAFWLVIEGDSAAEVAAKLSMPQGAVYTARSRVSRRIKSMLIEFEDHLPDL